jgi:predicted ATP-grasp superfamily ATP-dependent carboligase
MRIFLAVVRALGRSGKAVHAFPFSRHAPALKSKYIARTHRVPEYETDRAGWQRTLMELLRDERFDLVVPCSDPAIAVLDENRGRLTHQNLAIPGTEAMATLFDKEETHRLCETLGIPDAPSARLNAADTAPSLIARFGLPLVLKPRRSFWADRGRSREDVEIVATESELAALLAAIEDRSRYLVESYFEGVGVGVSVLARDGAVVQAFQHRRLREGMGGCSSYRVSEPVDADLRQACEAICGHTRLTGVCMFEFRRNRNTGAWILLETNARFWGSMPLPLALGLDFPSLLYDLTVLNRNDRERAYAAGVRSRNFMLDGYNLIKRLRQRPGTGAAAWLLDVADFALQPIRWMTGRERSDSFVADDLAPALWEFVALFGLVKRLSLKR